MAAASATKPSLVRTRIAFAAAFCALCFSLVGVRLVHVMIFGAGEASAARALAPRHAMRADLVDRNGVLIARDLPVADLYASPAVLWDANEAAKELSSVTGANEERLTQAFSKKRGYIPVARALPPDVQDQVMSLGLPGLTFEPGYKRYYPGGRAMAHAVGQVDSDDNGVSGLELGLDSEVRGSKAPIQLSLDMRIQYALQHEVGEAMDDFHAKAAGGLVLDVHTGEVLAMMSLPDYEPNTRQLGEGDSARNRMTQDVYELGSIFKIFAFAEAMDEKTTRPDEVFNISGGFKVAKYTIEDFEHLGPTISAAMIFAESSNIGTAQIASRAGPQRQQAFLQKLGLLTPLKTELPEVAAPLRPRQWGPVESATISFGHGISVNPLAFAAAAASVVNGGTMIHPTFLKTGTEQHGERIISENASETMRSLMRLVVTEGTGTKADVPGYDVGGKTGTAEKAIHGRYSKNLQLVSFVGVFPISNPRYLVFAMLDEPHATKETFGFATAGWTVAPAVGRVIARIAPLLDVPKNDTIAAATP